MKRILSLILALIMMMSTLIPFAGCSKKESEYVTNGEWIEMLGQQFGLEDYVSEKAYFKDVKEKDDIYKYVQSCADWGIISNKDSDKFNPKTDAKISYAIETALAAAEYDSSEVSAVDYALEQGLIDNKGYMDVEGKLTREKAAQILTWTNDYYINKPFEEYENVVLKDTLIDATDNGAQIKEVSDGTYSVSGQNYKVGDIIILPGDEMNPEGIARKVVSVTDNNGVQQIVTEEPELSDICEEFEVAATVVPEIGAIQLADGVSFSSGTENLALITDSNHSGIGLRSSEGGVTTVGKDPAGLSFNIDVNFTKGTIAGTAGIKNLLGIGENFTVNTTNPYSIQSALNPDAGKLFEKKGIVPGSDSVGKKAFKNEQYTEDYKAGKITADELKKKLDTTKDQYEKDITSKAEYTLKGGYEIIGSVGISNLYVQPELKTKKVLGVPTGIQSFSVTLNYDVTTSLTVKGKVETGIKSLFVVPVPVGPTGLTVDIEFGLFVEANGKISVTAQISNKTKLSYNDGSGFKKTSDKSSSVSLDASVSISAGASVSAVVRLFGVGIVDTTLKASALAEATMGAKYLTEYTDDGESITVTRKTQLQFGGGIYAPIISLEIGARPTLASKIGLKFKWEIVGKDKAPFKRTFEAEKVDVWSEVEIIKKRKENEKDAENEARMSGYLGIDNYYTTLDEGMCVQINVATLPKGYTADEIVWSSSNPVVATVNGGTIEGNAPGTAVITAATNDGIYEAYCTVTIGNDWAVDFTPLEDNKI